MKKTPGISPRLDLQHHSWGSSDCLTHPEPGGIAFLLVGGP